MTSVGLLIVLKGPLRTGSSSSETSGSLKVRCKTIEFRGNGLSKVGDFALFVQQKLFFLVRIDLLLNEFGTLLFQ